MHQNFYEYLKEHIDIIDIHVNEWVDVFKLNYGN